MKTLYDVYQLITSREHYWRLEKSVDFVQRMASTLLSIEINDEQAQQVIDAMNTAQSKINELRNNEKLDYKDISNAITAINTLYIELPLKSISFITTTGVNDHLPLINNRFKDKEMTALKNNEYQLTDANGNEFKVTAITLKEAWKQALVQCLFEKHETLQYPITVNTNQEQQTLDEPPLDTDDELKNYQKWLSEALDVIVKNNKRLKKAITKGF